MSNISNLRRQKFALKRASVEARDRLGDELHESSDKAANLVRSGAIVLGSLMTGYILFRLVASPEKRDKKEAVRVEKSGAGTVRRAVRNRLKQRIVQEASMYLLGIARDQLLYYLTKKSEQDKHDTSEAGTD